MSDFNDIVYSKEIIEFVTVANEFGKMIEGVSGVERKEFLDKSSKILPLMYLKSLLLPKLEPVLEDGVEKFVSEADYNHFQKLISQKLGLHDHFVEVYTPDMVESEDSVHLSISECYVDIYQDVKDFLISYNIGQTEIMHDSVWECKESFDRYWGPRLIKLMEQIHNLLFSTEDLDEGEEESI